MGKLLCYSLFKNRDSVAGYGRIPFNHLILAQADSTRTRTTRSLLPKDTQKAIIEAMSDLKLQPDELELLASYEQDE